MSEGLAMFPHKAGIFGVGFGVGGLTISDLRTKRNVLGGGALDLLFGRHCN